MAQSVILLSDVPGLGQIGDKCNVKDGYARNYLIPQRLAVRTSADAVKRFDRQKEKLAAERQKQLDRSKTTAEKLSKLGLVFERPVGQSGRLFGSVTPLDISTELAKQGARVEKKSVLMSGPIKTVGDHTVRVRIHSQVIVDIPVKVKGIETKKESAVEEAAEEMPKE